MSHEKNIALIQELNNCAMECSHCAMACFDEKEVTMLIQCTKLNIDCADVCRLTASLLSRGSETGLHLLDECAELCDACAEECESHTDMEHCKKCAEVCRHCAEACSEMV